MSQFHCHSRSGSVSRMDDLSSDEEKQPPTPLDVWLSPVGTPRMKRHFRETSGAAMHMSPRAIKRRLAQHAEKSKLSPMPSIQLARKNFNENLALAAQSTSGQKKMESLHKSPSKLMMEKAMKEMEQQSVYSGKTLEKRITWRNFHRWVEQTPEEPLPMILFKWILMFIGLVMVVAAMVIMIGVIHAATSGALRQRRLQNLNRSSLTSMDLGLDSEIQAADMLTATAINTSDNF